MSDRDTLIMDIEACNVLPALRASLQHGASEEEIHRCVGWRLGDLEARDTRVSGESTYRHLELMYAKNGYPEFLLAAVALHTPSSLGVVGLACKTAGTVAEAMACHQRFQHLTNGTAVYRTEVVDELLLVTEERTGPERLGNLLMSDFTLLVAVQLLRTITLDPLPLRWATSRRSQMPAQERQTMEQFLEAPLRLGAQRAQLALGPSILRAPVRNADGELSAFFQSFLSAGEPTAPEDDLVHAVRTQIRRGLVHGTPQAQDVARRLAIGQRTLQRRLAERGLTFTSLLEATRRDLAAEYLTDPDLSLTEVAYLLGFVEQASFFRAFRRWYSMTPNAFREKTRKSGSTSRVRRLREDL